MSRDTSNRRSAPGIIDPSCLYRLDELCARMNWSRHAWRSARRKGLRVLRSGSRAFVLGADVISFLEAQRGRDE